MLEYEVWNWVHAYGVAHSVGNEAQALLLRVGMVEMTRSVLAKALEPLPVPLRTLDSLHLATMDFLRSRGATVELASYDDRLVAAARAVGMPVAALGRRIASSAGTAAFAFLPPVLGTSTS